jgi:ParB/RepB/Spo0J family partition protein
MTKLFDLDVIDPNPYQIRDAQENTHVRQIAESIAERGLLQTPIGRKVNGRVQLAFGNTRYEAFRLLVQEGKAGFEFMPVEIQDLTDEQMFELGVSENVDRKELNPIEKARGMRIYRDKFGKTSEQIGKRFGGLSDSAVRNIMRYLDLPENIQKSLANGEMLQGAARELLRLLDLNELERSKAEDQDTYPKPSEIVELARIGTGQKRITELIDSLMGWLRPATVKPIAGQVVELPLMAPPEEEKIPAPVETPALQVEPEVEGPKPVQPVEEPRKVAVTPQAEKPALASVKPQASTPAPAPQPAAQAEPASPTGAPEVKKGSWACATITLSLTMWPDDGDEQGRMVMIGARVNQESPRMVMARQAEIILPAQLAEMLAKLREDYGGEA